MSTEEFYDEIRKIIKDEIKIIVNSTSNTKPEMYLTFREATQYLKMSCPTLRRRMKDGELRFKRSGRKIYFLRSDLDRHLRTFN